MSLVVLLSSTPPGSWRSSITKRCITSRTAPQVWSGSHWVSSPLFQVEAPFFQPLTTEVLQAWSSQQPSPNLPPVYQCAPGTGRGENPANNSVLHMPRQVTTTALQQWAALLLLQPRTLMAFFLVWTCCWSMLSLLSAQAPRCLSAKLLASCQSPASSQAGDILFQI